MEAAVEDEHRHRARQMGNMVQAEDEAGMGSNL